MLRKYTCTEIWNSWEYNLVSGHNLEAQLYFSPLYKKLSWTNLNFLYKLFVWISETKRWFCFLSGFPPFGSFHGEKMYLYINKEYERKNNATFKDKQRDNVDKANPPSTYSCWYRNLKYRKIIGGSKSRWRRWFWIPAWSKSFKIFVPIMSKNTASGTMFSAYFTLYVTTHMFTCMCICVYICIRVHHNHISSKISTSVLPNQKNLQRHGQTELF